MSEPDIDEPNEVRLFKDLSGFLLIGDDGEYLSTSQPIEFKTREQAEAWCRENGFVIVPD